MFFLMTGEIGHFENLNDQFLEPQWVFILVAERIISVAEALEATLFLEPQWVFISVAEALEATRRSEHHARFLSISMNSFSLFDAWITLEALPDRTKLNPDDRGIVCYWNTLSSWNKIFSFFLFQNQLSQDSIFVFCKWYFIYVTLLFNLFE